MNKTEKSNYKAVNFCELLGLLFISLKLIGHINDFWYAFFAINGG
ncbi:hypothetical protein [Tuanshanicoccus yangjingiae]